MQLQRLFTEHPASVGESYWQHLVAASSFAGRMLVGAVCCFIHALLPFLFVKTGSNMIAGLHDRMVVNRSRLAAARSSAPAGAREATAD